MIILRYRKKGTTEEECYPMEVSAVPSANEWEIIDWVLSETFEPEKFRGFSLLEAEEIVEIGPRLNFATAWNTNMLSILRSCGITKVTRIERSRRRVLPGPMEGKALLDYITENCGYDKMTETVYVSPLVTFETGKVPEPAYYVQLLEGGIGVLRKLNKEMGLGMDDWDIEYYFDLFVKKMQRNPTNVECFDLGQSNSEHSRHWFFTGRLKIDGEKQPRTLMQIVREPYERNPNNSIIAFRDNSSAIKGYPLITLIPEKPGSPCALRAQKVFNHIIFTAETHNFPSGVAPFPGAETGTGGRIRDTHATGRGSHVVAGTAAYCVGNLRIPGYELPWENKNYVYPSNLASPLKIEIDASNGASDYGNKFGEPLIQGFSRSFGLTLPDGDRREWIKPIMFTGGVGRIDARHVEKREAEVGMVVVKAGGPAYRIGMGGGAASSMMQGENIEELDFNAVQRGDAEMEQKLNRVIRACVEMGDDNPIESIHDQGAGGNCNVVKEICSPAGAEIDIRKVIIGDNTLSVLEIWGAEYQELDAFLIYKDKWPLFKELCEREKVPVADIGHITGTGKLVLIDSAAKGSEIAVLEDLELTQVLGNMGQKVYDVERFVPTLAPLVLPEGLTVREALGLVLKLLSVGSKRFLVNKVDRSVTGLVARQQNCGPLQLAVADFAITALSLLPDERGKFPGVAISIGEQPILGLLDPKAMARRAVGEAITNIMFAGITALENISCSANWMWAPKLPGEAAKLYDAAGAMGEIQIRLGVKTDGGKDSLSMAARVTHPDGATETVKAPGQLAISFYCSMDDVELHVTPDIKRPGESRLIYVDLARGERRLGGSALAQCVGQIGDKCPDVDSAEDLKYLFLSIQKMIGEGIILSGHDVSDGGVITTLLEMAFSGNCGLDIKVLPRDGDVIADLFAEELGIVFEILPENEARMHNIMAYNDLNEYWHVVADTKPEKNISVVDIESGQVYLDEDMLVLRDIWEETSHRLQIVQGNICAKAEKENIYDRPGPQYRLTYAPEPTPENWMQAKNKPEVAILREEGSNSDREMAAAFYDAGFDPYDITMSDLTSGRITSLDRFKGLALVGGFSYADVADSAKGWAAGIRFHTKIKEIVDDFYCRPDTFSLGVCNGCQLMPLLGWVPFKGLPDAEQPRFIANKSKKFESRFATVKIQKSRAIMLKGMEGSVLGVWVSHGEGQASFPSEFYLGETLQEDLAPVRYVDDHNFITTRYPFNPNGSREGIAAFCDTTGRHFVIMPHPERTLRKWNWGWMPDEFKKLPVSPWLKLFQNAREWCG